MRAVLGIDAAWTAHNPSGVSLVVEDGQRWRLAALASSYRDFLRLAGHAPGDGAGLPVAPDLMRAARAICGRPIDLVAIDMPLAMHPITSSRPSDRAVSKAYAKRWCSTHQPSAVRPGPISDALRLGFAAAGYPLLTRAITPPGLIEVYPHPALVELASSPKRLEYKIARAAGYWPDQPRDERRRRVIAEWRRIAMLLSAEIDGIAALLPEARLDLPTAELKAHEDALDAVVCAWVGVCALEGRALPFGDDESAIWIPDPNQLAQRAPIG